MVKIGINGFGRIGRLVYRIAHQRGCFDIVGVNDLVPADNLAYLLKYDSTHGRFGAEVKADGLESVREAIHHSTLEVSGLPPRDIMLVKPGTLPKTSSGKLQRAKCRELYLSGELELVV